MAKTTSIVIKGRSQGKELSEVIKPGSEKDL